jgi:hypothetical protein
MNANAHVLEQSKAITVSLPADERSRNKWNLEKPVVVAQANYNTTRAELGRLAGQLYGRGVKVFMLQLAMALWILAAKIELKGEIKNLFLFLAEHHPHLQKQRALNGWCECALAAFSKAGLLGGAPRHEGKRLKTRDAEELRRLKWAHVEKIANQYGSMNSIRRELLPRKTAKGKIEKKQDENDLLMLVEKLGHQLSDLKAPALNLQSPLRAVAREINATLGLIKRNQAHAESCASSGAASRHHGGRSANGSPPLQGVPVIHPEGIPAGS